MQELTPGAWVELAPGVRVMNQLARYNDSWLAVETEEALLLNLNDCILDTEAYMHEVMAQLPRPVDVLMVQYSYSARVANRGEHERFREEAERVLRTITMMTRVARPRYVIPFASFVWFCHEENAYMNAGATPVAVAAEHLGATTGAEPVVMYPGDRWQVGDAHDSRRAVERYERDLHAMLGGERQLVQAPIHDFDELVAAGHEFRRRLLSADGLALMARVMLGSVPATSIYLEDLGQAANYSLSRGLRRTTTGRGRCDVALTSDALSYMFRHMWGGETLRINGRFQVPPDGHYANFDRYITLGNLANHGRSYAWHLLTHTPVYRSSPVRHLREWTSRCQRLIPRMPGKSGSPRSAGRRPRGLDRRRLMPARPRARAGGRRGGR